MSIAGRERGRRETVVSSSELLLLFFLPPPPCMLLTPRLCTLNRLVYSAASSITASQPFGILSSSTLTTSAVAMGSKSTSKSTPVETALVLPLHPELKDVEHVELFDTHTHVLSTFEAYASKYPEGNHANVKDFVKALLRSEDTNKVDGVIDVWCEAPMADAWDQVVASLGELKDDGLSCAYRFVQPPVSASRLRLSLSTDHFVVGAHPNEASKFSDELLETFKRVHAHQLCVGWGEIGLDYHYDELPEGATTTALRDHQAIVLRRQLQAALATGLDKAFTIHTREADDMVGSRVFRRN